jgi:hypothetical protein
MMSTLDRQPRTLEQAIADLDAKIDAAFVYVRALHAAIDAKTAQIEAWEQQRTILADELQRRTR